MGSQGDNRNEPSEDARTYELVSAVASARGVDPLDLDERLIEVVDPDALWQLFAPRLDGTRRAGGQVTFRLAQCEVTVRADAGIDVVPPESSHAAD